MALLGQPVQLVAVLVGFALAGYSLSKIRGHDGSWHALLAVATVAAIFAGGDVLAKYIVPPLVGDNIMATLGGITAFLAATNAAAAVVGLLALRGWPRLNAQGWARAAGFGVLLYGGIGFLLLVIAASPNPGYVAAISMLSALWLAIWARYKLKEKNNLSAGLGLLVGALLVALAAV
jgi:drug/metabolite transporter (DMT)-like permease